MRKIAVVVLVAGTLAGAAAGGSAAAASSGASSYCHALHRDHPATYHHRYGHNARSFGRCAADWDHRHQHHDDHGGDHHDD